MVRNVVVNVDCFRRLVLNPQGGMDLECYVEGIGWCLDNDAVVPDGVIEGHLARAIGLLILQADKLGMTLKPITWKVEARMASQQSVA